MGIPGVAQVSIWGQRDRQLQVQVDPAAAARQQRHPDPADRDDRQRAVGVAAELRRGVDPGHRRLRRDAEPAPGRPAHLADHHGRPAGRGRGRGRGGRTVRLGDVDDRRRGPPAADRRRDRRRQAEPDAGRRAVPRRQHRAGDAGTSRPRSTPWSPGLRASPSTRRSTSRSATWTRRCAASGWPALIGCVLLALVVGVLRRSWRAALIAVVALTSRRPRRPWRAVPARRRR